MNARKMLYVAALWAATAVLLVGLALPAKAQNITIGGRGFQITFWGSGYPQYPPPYGGYGGYEPAYAPPPYYGGYDHGRGSYSTNWDNRSGRWSESESYRDGGGSYRRSTTCSPRTGCVTRETVTRETHGPYRVPPLSRF